MQFTISKSAFIAAVSEPVSCVRSRVIPSLSSLKIVSDGSVVTATGSDLDVTVVSRFDAPGEPGEAALSAKLLFSIIKGLPGPDVSFRWDGHSAVISSGSAVFKVIGIPDGDYPEVLPHEIERFDSLESSKVVDALSKVSYAASDDPSRPVLNGVLFELMGGGVFRAVASDGHRLAVWGSLENKETPAKSFVLPNRACSILSRVLRDGEVCEVGFSPNGVVSFSGKFGTFVAKPMSGVFPNYLAIIPSISGVPFGLPREVVLGAVSRVQLINDSPTSVVNFDFSGDSLVISASSASVGDGRESVSINGNGSDLKCGFNPSYLAEPLRVMAEDSVEFFMSSGSSPGVLLGSGFIYMVMPVRQGP